SSPPRIDAARSWRNWQTHQLEGLALARAWWFESTRPHQHFRRGNVALSERSEPKGIPVSDNHSTAPNLPQKSWCQARLHPLLFEMSYRFCMMALRKRRCDLPDCFLPMDSRG